MRRQAVCVDLGVKDYDQFLRLQDRLVQARLAEEIPDLLLTVEHPHVYTQGRASRAEDLLLSPEDLARREIRVYPVNRGGRITYHGPGQIVGYPIVNLREFNPDVHRYLRCLEEVLLRTLEVFGIAGERVAGRTGVWVGGAKIAAIGVGIRRWITFHGFALNVAPDLGFFGGIVPCGIAGCRVTSMSLVLGRRVQRGDVLPALRSSFAAVFERELREKADGWLYRFAAGPEEAPLAAR